jgi:hypothetical protein
MKPTSGCNTQTNHTNTSATGAASPHNKMSWLLVGIINFRFSGHTTTIKCSEHLNVFQSLVETNLKQELLSAEGTPRWCIIQCAACDPACDPACDLEQRLHDNQHLTRKLEWATSTLHLEKEWPAVQFGPIWASKHGPFESIWVTIAFLIFSVMNSYCLYQALLSLFFNIFSIFLFSMNIQQYSPFDPNPASDIAHGRWVISGIPQQPGQRSAKYLTEIWWVWRSVSVLANSLCLVRSCGWALKE